MKESQYFRIISIDKQNGQRPKIVIDYGIKDKDVPVVFINRQRLDGEKALEWLSEAGKREAERSLALKA